MIPAISVFSVKFTVEVITELGNKFFYRRKYIPTRFMKTAILQCLQQFSSKNSKNVYHDNILRKLQLLCHCKIVQNVRFSL